MRVGAAIVGINGAIATTLTAGLSAVRRGLAQPLGMVSELPEFTGLGLPGLDELVFGGWDIRLEPHADWARRHGLVPSELLSTISSDLESISVFEGPLIGVVPAALGLSGVNLARNVHSRRQALERLAADITAFRTENELDTVVVLNVSSTEPPLAHAPFWSDAGALARAIDDNDARITSSVLYAYAALREGCPYVNITPSEASDIPALSEVALGNGLPHAGKDLKTGQTLCKTVVAPMLRARNLRVEGWYSMNILGNDDGAVLTDPANRASKIATKLGVLEDLLGYDGFDHQVHIHFYAPRGDAKEAWDTIDFCGWLNTKMTLKINWLGADSALAAPLAVDLVRFAALAYHRGESGEMTHLAPFFKSPLGAAPPAFADQMRDLFAYAERVRVDMVDR
jgi:myo-inositol-1-phosphate synthase